MGSVWFWIFLTAVFARSQGLQIEVNLWIRKWAANYDPRAETTTLLALVASPVAQKLLALGPTADDPTAAAAVAFASPTPRADSTTYYLSWYVILSTVYLASIAVRMGTLFYGSLRASTKVRLSLPSRSWPLGAPKADLLTPPPSALRPAHPARAGRASSLFRCVLSRHLYDRARPRVAR